MSEPVSDMLGRFVFALFAILVLSVSAASLEARAADDDNSMIGIAAIVNDEVISQYDLDQRTRLVLVTSGIPQTPENTQRVRSQVLRSLIDEKLEMQEADRQKVTVPEDQINQAYASIAARAEMTPDQIDHYLEQNGISKSSMVNQIKAEIAWNQVVGQQFGSLISVGDDQVDEVLRKLKDESGETQYLVGEILLTYENPQQEAEVSAGAAQLVQQIRAGAPFQAVASQFSQSPSAASGGDIGWVHASQLPSALVDIVPNMQPGQVSDPIQTVNGYYIVQLRSRQTGFGADEMKNQFTLMHVVLPLSATASPAQVDKRAAETKELAASFTNCKDFAVQAAKYEGADISKPKTISVGGMEPNLRKAVADLQSGQVAPPIRSARGMEILAVCDRVNDTGGAPSRESIEDNLYSQQLSLMARRHLRDLRRDAVIDVR
ncbi:MAG: peptidylprolyl isomerase [Parvibaculaceae bacterium]|nr:peptidylprolyl isomerase [Parvibaculaceae bacterium]